MINQEGWYQTPIFRNQRDFGWAEAITQDW